MMNKIIFLLYNNICLKIVVIMIVLDTILGVLRAVKEKKFNSNVGINGAIRKIAMLVCIVTLVALDILMHINFVAYVPEDILVAFGFHKIGLCEFFSILFVLYEAVSILKNMMLCGLPVPNWLQKRLQKLLNEMTNEMNVEEG